MTLNRRDPRNVFRKNTPGETRENWQYVKQRGGALVRAILLFLCLLMLIPFALGFYGKGYFDGVQAARSETISKESK